MRPCAPIRTLRDYRKLTFNTQTKTFSIFTLSLTLKIKWKPRPKTKNKLLTFRKKTSAWRFKVVSQRYTHRHACAYFVRRRSRRSESSLLPAELVIIVAVDLCCPLLVWTGQRRDLSPINRPGKIQVSKYSTFSDTGARQQSVNAPWWKPIWWEAYMTPEPCQHTGLNRGGPNRRVIRAGTVLMSCQYESEIFPSGRKLHGHLDKATKSRLLSGNLSWLQDFSTYIIMSTPAGCKLWKRSSLLARIQCQNVTSVDCRF